jgi:hypothetical protein
MIQERAMLAAVHFGIEHQGLCGEQHNAERF